MIPKLSEKIQRLIVESERLAESLLGRGDSRPSDIAMKALDNNLKELERANLSIGIELRGLWHALRGESEQAHRCHKIALEKFPGPAGYAHYANSLTELNEHDASLELALQAAELAPESPDVLSVLLASALNAGDFGAFMEFFPAYKKLVLLTRHPDDKYAPVLEKNEAIYEALLAHQKLIRAWEEGEHAEDLDSLFKIACASGTFKDCSYEEGDEHGPS